MDIGTLLLAAALAYGLGILWYSVLPGKVPSKVWRVACYPLLGIYASETVVASNISGDPKFGGVHLISALIGSLVAAAIDWVITKVRKPTVV